MGTDEAIRHHAAALRNSNFRVFRVAPFGLRVYRTLTPLRLLGIKLQAMPTYEYICEKCGHQFEQFQSISAKPLEICPEPVCTQKRWGKGRVKRAISGGAGLLFKGSGFYITDYRSDKYKEAAKKESSASSPAKSSDSKPAESKPATSKPPAKT